MLTKNWCCIDECSVTKRTTIENGKRKLIVRVVLDGSKLEDGEHYNIESGWNLLDNMLDCSKRLEYTRGVVKCDLVLMASVRSSGDIAVDSYTFGEFYTEDMGYNDNGNGAPDLTTSNDDITLHTTLRTCTGDKPYLGCYKEDNKLYFYWSECCDQVTLLTFDLN